MKKINKLKVELETPFVECIINDRSAEYVYDNIIVEIAYLHELQTLVPNIQTSMSAQLVDGRYLILVVKEEILAAPKNVQFDFMNFLVHHEIGHIENGDMFEPRLIANTIQERKADKYAAECTQMSRIESIRSIRILYGNARRLIERQRSGKLQLHLTMYFQYFARVLNMLI